MDECDVPVEEVGECGQPGDETPTLADPGWKDELNLAEFPIAALSDRIPDGQTTLVFEDRLERRDSQPIVRRLTIMGTHKHGLPTSLDDEVLVGLIQLTKRRSNFTDPRVHFSRYELIEPPGLAAERPKLPANRGSTAPVGGRCSDVRESLVGQFGQELGRRTISRARQRDALRP